MLEACTANRRSFMKTKSAQQKLSTALLAFKAPLAGAFCNAVFDPRTASWATKRKFSEIEEWNKWQLETAVELLAQSVRSGELMFHELFCGWVRSFMVQTLAPEGAPKDYQPGQAVALIRETWPRILQSKISQAAVEMLKCALANAVENLGVAPNQTVRVLFIGDCIQHDIISALLGRCDGAAIGIERTHIGDLVDAVIHNRIKTFAPDQFDLIFYSPFSYSFSAEYGAILNPRNALSSSTAIRRYADAALQKCFATLDVLSAQFTCPIYVHNTSGAIQTFGGIRAHLKELLTRSNRSRAREIINKGLNERLSRNAANCFLLDEDALRARFGAAALGRVYVKSRIVHPTLLGIVLGREMYFEAMLAVARLKTKKVLVCDLDNTLWQGVIGEGSVVHNSRRQNILKELRRRGVLLSINSKNDPRNINWTGATLEATDFVAPQINWELKSGNMEAIRDALNLKLKDFVFIDDRADELELMRRRFPEIELFDATLPETWRALERWCEQLPATPDEDRTLLYRQRWQRERFVAERTVADESAAFHALELSAKIRPATSADLARAAELINRTNQFNLCGTRTTAKELAAGNATVYICEAADKFGSMGVVGVMRTERTQERIDIPVFVLSCRAFGFGIEYALLGALKQTESSERILVGHYRETQFNEPCRQLYPRSGLTWNGSEWIGTAGTLTGAPAWLKVEYS